MENILQSLSRIALVTALSGCAGYGLTFILTEQTNQEKMAQFTAVSGGIAATTVEVIALGIVASVSSSKKLEPQSVSDSIKRHLDSLPPGSPEAIDTIQLLAEAQERESRKLRL
ncbi:MAG: hypothetical protein ACM37W_20900 [Actinomycetota bacterium]